MALEKNSKCGEPSAASSVYLVWRLRDESKATNSRGPNAEASMFSWFSNLERIDAGRFARQSAAAQIVRLLRT
jgi:hypothetical protein